MDAQTGVELTHLFSHPFADKLIMNAASLVFLKIRKEFKVISFTLLFAKFFFIYIIPTLHHFTQNADVIKSLSIRIYIYTCSSLCVCMHVLMCFLLLLTRATIVYIGDRRAMCFL